MFRSVLTILLAGAALAACGSAPQDTDDAITVENGAATPAGPAAAEAQGDEFVSTVLGDYDFVLASARQANEKAARPDVKQFAQRLASEIGTSRDSLKAIADAAGLAVKLPTDSAHSSELAMLSSTSGSPLERAFVDQQLQTLSALVGLMRAYKNGGDNPELKAWAEANQGMVNDRLLDLQTISAEMEGSD